MIASSNDRRKELKEIASKGLPGFGTRIDIGKAAQMARKLSKTLAGHFNRQQGSK